MTDKLADQTLRVDLRRTFNAPRERVFAAWTDAEQMSKWFCPPDAETFKSEVDLKVGGSYVIGMKNRKTGEKHVVRGTYKEIRPPERLVFTWLWDGQNAGTHTTLVTLDFRVVGERDDKTELVLKHEGFPDQHMCDQHRQGWESCLTGLDGFITKKQ